MPFHLLALHIFTGLYIMPFPLLSLHIFTGLYIMPFPLLALHIFTHYKENVLRANCLF